MAPAADIICRRNWWTDAPVSLATFAFAFWMGWGPWVALGAAIAARIVTEVVRPRGPNRWTE
jgi:hypothetical protein